MLKKLVAMVLLVLEAYGKERIQRCREVMMEVREREGQRVRQGKERER